MNPLPLLRAASLALALLAAAPAAVGKPGDLDPAFGIAGVATTHVTTPAYPNHANDPAAVLLQPDGRLVVVGTVASSVIALVRYNADGSLDPTFGTAGIVVAPLSGIAFAAALQQDGKILIAGGIQQLNPQGINVPLILLRYLPDGSPDGQFGLNGVVTYPAVNGEFGQTLITHSIVIGGDGKPVVSGVSSYVSLCCTVASGCSPGSGSFAVLLRFNLDGSLDSSFGDGGAVCTSFLDDGGGVAAIQPDGKILLADDRYLAASGWHPRVVRYDTAGAIDPTYGTGGIASATVGANGEFSGGALISAIVVQPDGKALVAIKPVGVGRATVVATRLNPDGSVDNQFAGGNGVIVALGDAVTPNAHFDPLAGVQTGTALQTDGKVLLVGQPWDSTAQGFRLGAVRFNADGTLDTGYGNTGITIGPEVFIGPDGFSPGNTLAQPDNKLVVAGSGSNGFELARFLADAGTNLVAVEYYYPAWGFYFVTAFPDEIAALDGGAFGGVWQRTGQTFDVWSLPYSFASPTCRFFSTAFAPKSSHFYTPFPAECAAVKSNPAWQFEGIAFYVEIPTGFGTGNGSCPGGTVALYRAYNDSMGGTPNHRYTTSLAMLNAMLAQGWVFEGEANTKVFACVPQ